MILLAEQANRALFLNFPEIQRQRQVFHRLNNDTEVRIGGLLRLKHAAAARQTLHTVSAVQRNFIRISEETHEIVACI